MAVTLTYDATLARVRLSATVGGTVAYAVADRSTNGVQWTPVRGSGRLAPSAGVVSVDDYEFPPGVAVTYRVRGYTAVDVVVSTETEVITALIGRTWLKSVARPFLNSEVTVVAHPEVSRKSRAGVFAVAGRTLPVVVSEVRGSRVWELRVRAETAADARRLDFLLAGGDVLYVQVPAGSDLPGGYVSVGDYSERRISPVPADLRRVFTLPMTEVAAPGPDVVGYASTWAGLLADFGTWADVLAAFATWADVLEYVADPETVIVP
jgi:hypothetical protein